MKRPFIKLCTIMLLLLFTAGAAFAQEMTPSVTVEDQTVADGTVTVASVVSNGPGWIVIHADDNGAPGPVIGNTAVTDGENTDVVVEIDESAATDTLYAMLHTDDGEVGTYEFPDADGPVSVDGQVVTPAFSISAMMDDSEMMEDEDAMMEEEGEMMAEGTIVDIASADEQFSTLVTALQAAGLVETLQGEGPFTVFAPTNAAFEALPEGTLDSLLNDIPALTDVLLYHVVDGSVMAADVVAMDSATTLQGATAPITVDGETVMVGDATVTATDIQASNGVIHVIDSVLLPPAEDEAMMEEGEMAEGEMAEGEMAEGEAMAQTPALCSEEYTVQADDWLSTLADRFYGDVLAFPALVDATNAVAASDDRFTTIDNPDIIEIGQLICVPTQEDADALLSGTATAESLMSGEGAMMEEGEMAEGEMAEGEMMEEEGEMMAEGQTIVDIASADEQFSTLVTALQTAGLVETLQGEGPFTVFAPTNAAFEALPEGALDGLLADVDALTNVLLYHVVPGRVMAADVVSLASAETVQGASINITVDGETVMVNDATVTATDIEASNGVIHVIDSVIMPPAEDDAMMEEEGEMMEEESMEEGESMDDGSMEEGESMEDGSMEEGESTEESN